MGERISSAEDTIEETDSSVKESIKSNKTDFKLKSIRRDGDGHYILITGTINQEEVYAPISMPLI